MQDTAHIMMVLDIVRSAWLIHFCYKVLRLEKSFKKFYSRYQDLIEKYQRSVKEMVNDSFPRQPLFYILQWFNRFCCFT